MTLDDALTNEKLSQRFDNPFSLVNYAISLAKNRIIRGEEFDSNPATEILNLIRSGKNNLEELTEEEEEEESEEA